MIPKVFHFIYITNSSNFELDIFSYVAIASCKRINSPSKIILHTNSLPNGNYWSLVSDFVEVNEVDIPGHIYGNKINSFAHAADVIRLQELIKSGGVYLDLDTICVRPIPDNLFSENCVMGLELRPGYSFWSLLATLFTHMFKFELKLLFYKLRKLKRLKYVGMCNALIMATPNSKFLVNWLESYINFDNTNWNYQSVIYPFKILLKKYKSKEIKVVNHKYFFNPTYDSKGLFQLFGISDLSLQNFPKSCIHHLWISEVKKILNLNDNELLSSTDSYYARLVKQYV